MPAMEMIAAKEIKLYDQIVYGDIVLQVTNINSIAGFTYNKIYFTGLHRPTWVDYYISFHPEQQVEIYEFFKG